MLLRVAPCIVQRYDKDIPMTCSKQVGGSRRKAGMAVVDGNYTERAVQFGETLRQNWLGVFDSYILMDGSWLRQHAPAISDGFLHIQTPFVTRAPAPPSSLELK